MKKVTLRRFLNERGNFIFFLKDDNINGSIRGFSGHIKNTENNKTVYVSVSYDNPLFGNKSMYRLAKNERDYSSVGLKNGHNRWANNKEFADSVLNLLKNSEMAIEK